MEKIELIKEYFKLLEDFSDKKEDFAKILDPNFTQIEYPNTLNKNGQESNFASVMERAAMGAKMLSQQNYKILNYIDHGDQIAVESAWSAKIAVDIASLKAGSEMKANFCFICEFKDGKIIKQRNYDCFMPFS